MYRSKPSGDFSLGLSPGESTYNWNYSYLFTVRPHNLKSRKKKQFYSNQMAGNLGHTEFATQALEGLTCSSERGTGQ
jgi:hypothetical protein